MGDLVALTISMFLVLLLSMSKAVSALEIIHDSGYTAPAQPYYRQIKPVNKNTVQLRIEAPDVKPVSIEKFFPLVTMMELGTPARMEIAQLTIPLFIMGLDYTSIAWVEKHFSELQEIGARGLVVEGSDYAQFRRLRRRASELGMIIEIAPGDAIAKAYGISTYPILMVRN